VLDGVVESEVLTGPDLHQQAVAVAEEGSELALAAGLRARPLAAGVGVSWQSILAVAESEDARLIVTGADGVRGARVSLGSISRGVTHHAGVPVLVVPPPSDSVSSSVIPADALRASDSPVPVDPAVPAARSTLARTISRFTGSAREDALARASPPSASGASSSAARAALDDGRACPRSAAHARRNVVGRGGRLLDPGRRRDDHHRTMRVLDNAV
jgi:hypothetical protein